MRQTLWLSSSLDRRPRKIILKVYEGGWGGVQQKQMANKNTIMKIRIDHSLSFEDALKVELLFYKSQQAMDSTGMHIEWISTEFRLTEGHSLEMRSLWETGFVIWQAFSPSGWTETLSTNPKGDMFQFLLTLLTLLLWEKQAPLSVTRLKKTNSFTQPISDSHLNPFAASIFPFCQWNKYIIGNTHRAYLRTL